jgi:hypothetical protein
MPSTSTAKAGAKKRPSAKALALKEAAAKLSAQKAPTQQRTTRGNPPATAAPVASAPSRKRATRSKENQPSVMAAPASGASSAASAPTAENQDSEMAILRSECLQFFLARILLINYFLVELAAAKHELKLAQEAAAGSSKTKAKDTPIGRPRGEIKNLKAAMGLANDEQAFNRLCVRFFFYFNSCYAMHVANCM